MKIKPLPIAFTLLSFACLAGAVSITFNGAGKGPAGALGGKAPGAAGAGTEMQAKVTSGAESVRKALTSQVNIPSVVVVHAEPGVYQAMVTGYGEAAPRYSVDYSAEVSGRVESVSGQFESGKLVKQGEVLARLESTSYQQAVMQAKSELADAKLSLLEEERQSEQAKLEWQRSGLNGQPSSELVLRGPQLEAAKAAYENARISLTQAQKNLEKTVVKAPFDALVISRDVQPGSYVSTGTSVATLYSTDRVEVEIPLSASQWANLPDFTPANLSGEQWNVTLQSSDGSGEWTGYVARMEQHIESDTRQRSLVVAVDKPLEGEDKLYPGTFVQALINGKSLQNTWKLPASAVSQQGELWFVTSENTLNKIPAEKLFEKAGNVYLAPDDSLDSANIIVRPLSSYVVGMRVLPKAEG